MTDGGEIEACREALRRSGRRRHGRSAARLCRQCHLQDRRLSRLGPLTAPVRGHAKIMARFESMIANLALSDFAILDLFVDGCRPLASQRVPCGNRDASTTEIAQFLEVEHGQVVSLVEFFDTAMAMKLLGAK